ncbi:AAA family ATPase [Sulfobacillus thermosulfidooxidans]|uniref:AAA family ATPase n=1 Tax=Sulfobacillus thermosulfidooxidans TaxID=28034 RepID=UPI0006B5681B|nr:AAA family ATPase [Sulfobacillus thermosulfidooxidans]
MRLRGFRAENLLSFDNLAVDFSSPRPTILVGPNGVGKTNLFRLIDTLLGLVTHEERLRGAEPVDWRERLDAWKRNPDRPSRIEIDVEWTEPSEGQVIATYFQMALANREEIWRALKPTENLTGTLPGWMKFVDILFQSASGKIYQSAWSGTLGCQQTGLRDTVIYYRPKVAEGQWVHLLNPYAGLCQTVPTQLSSYSNPSLASVWIKCLPEKTQTILLKMLQGDKNLQNLTLSLDWKSLWSTVQTLVSAGSNQIVNTGLRNDDVATAYPPWQKFLRELEVEPNGNPTFERVLAYLLRRCIITEDLLSPPKQRYSESEWWCHTKNLASRHIGPYLLALKIGRDPERDRFSRIQETFKTLSTHDLDVTMEPLSNRDHAEVNITLVQTGDGIHSFPVHWSGSGSVEIAYLSAALTSSNAHVLLLDEPGRSLHPQALIRLRKLLEDRATKPFPPQIILITHSPYLIEPSHPHTVRRVYRHSSTQCTEIMQLPKSAIHGTSRRTQRDTQKMVYQRQDRWGRSPNWPALLFSTAVLLVDGDTELGALPEWYQKIYLEPPEALGLTILSLGGKANAGSAIRDLNGFKIPWIMLVDGDSLKPGSGNIWTELKRAQYVTTSAANRYRNREFEKQRDRLKSLNIYIMGESPDENFEAVLTRRNTGIKPPSELGNSKVIQGRWWAETVACPFEIHDVFERVRQIARTQAGL